MSINSQLKSPSRLGMVAHLRPMTYWRGVADMNRRRDSGWGIQVT